MNNLRCSKCGGYDYTDKYDEDCWRCEDINCMGLMVSEHYYNNFILARKELNHV